MKTIKLINNRLSWISVGMTLALMFFAYIEADENKKKKTDPYNFNNYKHNYSKENINA